MKALQAKVRTTAQAIEEMWLFKMTKLTAPKALHLAVCQLPLPQEAIMKAISEENNCIGGKQGI
jgi:hypothetical protein